MATADIWMKLGDRLPSITYVLVGPEGIVDLSTASGVTFNFELADGSSSAISGACTIESASLGRVRYDWGASDTTVAGTYNAEFVATFAGKQMTFPNDGYLKLIIKDDVT